MAFPHCRGESYVTARYLQTTPADGLDMRILYAAVITVITANPALAENIGVSMASFDDYFLTVLRNGMQDHANSKNGVSLQIEDAHNNASKQLSQIQDFIAQRVDASIVNP